MMRLLGFAVVLAALCAACLGGSGTAAPDTGVLRGQVLIVTASGIPIAGEVNQTQPHALGGRVRVTVRGVTAAGRRIARVVRTDAGGRFRLRLPAGRYRVGGPLRSRAWADVRTGATASVLLTGYQTVTLAL